MSICIFDIIFFYLLKVNKLTCRLNMMALFLAHNSKIKYKKTKIWIEKLTLNKYS